MAVSGERAPAFSCKNKALAWDKGGNHVAALALEATLLKVASRDVVSSTQAPEVTE